MAGFQKTSREDRSVLGTGLKSFGLDAYIKDLTYLQSIRGEGFEASDSYMAERLGVSRWCIIRLRKSAEKMGRIVTKLIKRGRTLVTAYFVKIQSTLCGSAQRQKESPVKEAAPHKESQNLTLCGSAHNINMVNIDMHMHSVSHDEFDAGPSTITWGSHEEQVVETKPRGILSACESLINKVERKMAGEDDLRANLKKVNMHNSVIEKIIKKFGYSVIDHAYKALLEDKTVKNIGAVLFSRFIMGIKPNNTAYRKKSEQVRNQQTEENQSANRGDYRENLVCIPEKIQDSVLPEEVNYLKSFDFSELRRAMRG